MWLSLPWNRRIDPPLEGVLQGVSLKGRNEEGGAPDACLQQPPANWRTARGMFQTAVFRPALHSSVKSELRSWPP
jgi:hypothetical protein